MRLDSGFWLKSLFGLWSAPPSSKGATMKQPIASGIGPTYTASTTLVAESPHLIERCWRVLTGNGHIVTCGIYWTHDAPGVELRVGHDDVSFFKNERVASNEVARALAMTWLLAVRERGGFDELEPANVGSDHPHPKTHANLQTHHSFGRRSAHVSMPDCEDQSPSSS